MNLGSKKLQINDNLCLVVSHDAGGAEVLSSYVLRNCINAVFALSGPAVKIFERKLGSIRNSSVELAVQTANVLLCSTSWQSSIEVEAISTFNSLNKISVAFLDHWINYENRFFQDDNLILPTQIWVGDSVAYRIAKKVFPKEKVQFEQNAYFMDIADYIKDSACEISIGSFKSILYVCEPINKISEVNYNSDQIYGYSEEDALRYFLDNVHLISDNIGTIKIRPHPSEPHAKYDWIFDEYQLPIIIGGDVSLVKEIVGSDFVVGCQSMAMVIGLIAKKTVISCIPPGGNPCQLPQTDIIKLNQISCNDNT